MMQDAPEVSGGDQQVRFELRPLRAGAWDMELFVRKGRFEQCIVYAEGEERLINLPLYDIFMHFFTHIYIYSYAYSDAYSYENRLRCLFLSSGVEPQSL